MTITLAELERHAGPIYRRLADALAAAIEDGRLGAGDRLPPQRDLAYRLQVTVGTVGRAYDLLIQRRLARGEVGRGTYVLAPAPPLGEPRRMNGQADGFIDLTASFPAPVPAQMRLGGLLPHGETAVDVLADILRYPPSAGMARHRAAASAWLGELGLAVEPERIVLTNGTEGGLAAALMTLARPGDVILGEALCYSGLRTLTSRLGRCLEPAPLDEHGLVPEALAAVARQTGARVVVVSPNLHNPTASFMPEARRRELAALAERLDLFLIEDDVYGPLVPERPVPLAGLAPARTVHLTSLSKFLAPGMRLGFLHGPPALVQEIVATQRDMSLGYAPLSAELFMHALRAGVVTEALQQQRREMMERQALAAARLAGLEIRAQATALHVWLHLPQPWTSAEAALAMARAGVMVAPAEPFFIGRGAAPRAIRLSISAPPTRTHLARALERVARVLKEGIRSGESGPLG